MAVDSNKKDLSPEKNLLFEMEHSETLEEVSESEVSISIKGRHLQYILQSGFKHSRNSFKFFKLRFSTK